MDMQGKHPFIGVVVPVSAMAGKLMNLREWLPKAVDCNFQIVLVHDIKDLETSRELIEIVESFRQGQVRILEGYFNSPGFARNAGMDICTSEWIFFWDSDDLPNPFLALSLISSTLENDPTTNFIVGGFQIKNLNAERLSAAYLAKNNFELAIQIGLWRCAIKRSSIESRFLPLMMAEDQLFVAQNAKNWEISFSSILIYQYQVGSSTQLTTNRQAMRDLLPALQISINELKYGENPNIDLIRGLVVSQFFSTIKFAPIRMRVMGIFQIGIALTRRDRALARLLVARILEFRRRGKNEA